MSKNDRFHRLLERLLEKSTENKVRWIEVPKGDAKHTISKYAVVFANKSRIELTHSKTLSDEVRASLIIAGREAEQLYADMNYSEFEMLWALVEEAERYTTEWDRTIDEIEQELAREGEVGIAEPQMAT